MIVFATDQRYVESPYVESEWSMFVNELKAGRKTGKLLTIIPDPIQGQKLPIDLRQREIFPTDNYEAICDYLK